MDNTLPEIDKTKSFDSNEKVKPSLGISKLLLNIVEEHQTKKDHHPQIKESLLPQKAVTPRLMESLHLSQKNSADQSNDSKTANDITLDVIEPLKKSNTPITIPLDDSLSNLESNNLTPAYEFNTHKDFLTQPPILNNNDTPLHLDPKSQTSLALNQDGTIFEHSQQLEENLTLQVIGLWPQRYTYQGELGSGGMGRVRRVCDQLLNRNVALKSLHPFLSKQSAMYTQFVQETQILAQLQHPNIPPVYDLGVLDNGSPFFTTSEIKGKSFADELKRIYREPDHLEGVTESWSLKNLISIFHKVCLAVAFAHDRGVVHRDLKPNNIMINHHEEILVVDWGLAEVVAADFHSQPTHEKSTNQKKMKLCGTPGYIAPELLNGTLVLDYAHDVFALGAIFFEILYGKKLIEGNGSTELLNNTRLQKVRRFKEQVTQTDTERLGDLEFKFIEYTSYTGQILPKTLVELCQKVCEFDPSKRTMSARELAQHIALWLDGSKQREAALVLVEHAEQLNEEIGRSLSQAKTYQKEAAEYIKDIELYEPEEMKWNSWIAEHKAQELTHRAELLKVKQLQLYRGALARKDDLVEAHKALALSYQKQHQQAEIQGDYLAAQRAMVIMSEHVLALPKSDILRRHLMNYIEGTGTLSLRVEPAEAQIVLFPQIIEYRRYINGKPKMLGSGPLKQLTVDKGSYLLEVSHPRYHSAIFPIYLNRNEKFEYLDPDGKLNTLKLLPLGTLSTNECYIPAGWCELGGDLGTPNSLPQTKVWIGNFVIQRFSVTNQDYLIFLNDLIKQNRLEEALLHVPREQSTKKEEQGKALYLMNEEGFFELSHDPKVKFGRPRQPVTLVMWRSARAYADWLAQKDNKPWRLPMEFEWEKAARGVDRRSYPWGNEHDPSRSCMKDSHLGEIEIVDVDLFPVDESIYGVRGLAGNTRDWCLDRFRESGPPMENGRLTPPSEEDLADLGFKSTRGGSYGNSASRARSADRDWWFPEKSYLGRGFRLVWSID